ncbi:hypothetical protein ESCO_000997 [Escovopsis weberi]|uniref:Translation machinery-associated protein 17 n=1 Tax=Escovopsis weberi TaxID=150374 RepID=A0A0M8MXX2_ESCWE|nr:hypothetical protein ESCO_000997 [Escovopsis weberi]
MSADTTPISPSRFAAALKDLSLPMLHLKTLEIRNSIAHLQYSNDQLKPFAEGAQSCSGPSDSAPAAPDQDCIDAIRENELVIDRMAERIVVIRAEVEARGLSWREFQSADEADPQAQAQTHSETQAQTHTEAQAQTQTGTQAQAQAQAQTGTRRDEEHAETAPPARSPWNDGTFQTGTIRNGHVHLDPAPGGLSDEQLRAALEERVRELGGPDDDEDGDDGAGLHL